MKLREAPVAWEWERGPTGRLLKIAYTTVRKKLESLARQAGLTHAQWSALGVLYHFPGSTNGDLEEILLIERPSVTSLIKGMEKRGWVVRKDDPHDGRSKRFFLTESGKALAEKTRSFAEVADREVLRALTDDEQALLRRLLGKLIRANSAPGPPPGDSAARHAWRRSLERGKDERSILMSQKRPNLPIGYWLKKADEALTTQINLAQQGNGLNRTEWQVLNLLHETSASTRAQIVEILRPFADADALQTTVQRLVDRGLVEGTGSETDPFRLTDAGRHLHGTALEAQKEVRQRAVRGISEAEYVTTVRVLQQLVTNLTGEGR
ncbi:MAG TPA: MarR family transcriptional regulator [Limnochordia bacterium]